MKRNHRNGYQPTRAILSSLSNDTHRTRSSANPSLFPKPRPFQQHARTDFTQNIPFEMHPRICTNNKPNPILAVIDQDKLNLNQALLTPHTKQTQHLEQLQRSKQNEQHFKNTIKNKFMKINKRVSCQSVDTRSIQPDYCRVSTVNSSCARGSEHSFHNQRQEINQWVKRTKAVLKQNLSNSVSKQKIKLKNLDKFNVDFVEYLKKKSYRRIEKDKINRIISRKENIVEMYQEHLMKNSRLGAKSRQHMRKCFDLLNLEPKRNG